jgi:hypothetical protein
MISKTMSMSHIAVQVRLDLVDLRGGNAVALGVLTDAVRASAHRLGQRPAWQSISVRTS